MQSIENTISQIVQELYDQQVTVELTRTDPEFGDYATNVALQLAGKLSKNPRDVAEAIAEQLRGHEMLDEVSIAGPGFINLKLTNNALWQLAQTKPAQPLKDKIIVAEYSDPNVFKELHIGHLYTSVVGDAVANLLEAAGAVVYRVNYGADVGLPIAKSMWGILRYLGEEDPAKLDGIAIDKRSAFLGERYAEAHQAYEDNPEAREQITIINKKIYEIHTKNDYETSFAKIYWEARKWSYDYFDQFYSQIGTKFDKYYPESMVSPLGLKVVREQLEKGVFTESDGAVIFRGEEHGLHTRVFINGQGLPTYEAKEVGVSMAKWEDYHYDMSVIITANEIDEYMKVVLKAMEQFAPDLVKRTRHLTHGMVKLAGGAKMSSRKGNIIRAVDVLETVVKNSQRSSGSSVNHQSAIAAIRYSFTKQRIGPDIIFDISESVSLEGNSGPYLQYSHARASSLLAKSNLSVPDTSGDLEPVERALLSKVGEFSEVVNNAIAELAPHQVCTYLYELAQTFNKFYEVSRVVGDSREGIRLALVKLYKENLSAGLNLLNIKALEKM